MAAENFAFQAQMKELLSIIVNSLYSTKDVFIRELVSNASDALDKRRRINLDSGNQERGQIRISVVDDSKIIIEDDGIGMTREELVENLGTIAHSGTKAFSEAVKGDTNELIGQFGVGFYSAFLVADEVRVTSKKQGSQTAHSWISRAVDFQICEDTLDFCGTRIELTVRDDEASREFLKVDKLRSVIARHCSFVTYPILVWTLVEKKVEEEKKKLDSVQEVSEVSEVSEVIKVPENEWKLVNELKPIWTKDPGEIKKDDYDGFYKSLTRDPGGPSCYKHFGVDGGVQFTAILYAARVLGLEGFEGPDFKRSHLHLYVRRVFVTDDSQFLIPEWLSFVRGIVDTNDLPLNVSREMLQDKGNLLEKMKKIIVRKSVDMLTDFAEAEKENYIKFFNDFGKKLKIGALQDEANRARLLDLLRFSSSASPMPGSVSLKDYKGRMKEGQSKIYFYIDAKVGPAKSLTAFTRVPFTEKLDQLGYEVLYMDDAIDEHVVHTIRDYDGTKLVDVSRDDLFLGDSDEKKKKVEKPDEKEFVEKVKKILGKRVEKVLFSDRLVSTPCIVSTCQYGWSANQERIMTAQVQGVDKSVSELMRPRKVFELNIKHPLVKNLCDSLEEFEVDNVETDKAICEKVSVLFQVASLASGFLVEDPQAFASSVFEVLRK